VEIQSLKKDIEEGLEILKEKKKQKGNTQKN
jgi:hypothetical protein